MYRFWRSHTPEFGVFGFLYFLFVVWCEQTRTTRREITHHSIVSDIDVLSPCVLLFGHCHDALLLDRDAGIHHKCTYEESSSSCVCLLLSRTIAHHCHIQHTNVFETFGSNRSIISKQFLPLCIFSDKISLHLGRQSHTLFR